MPPQTFLASPRQIWTYVLALILGVLVAAVWYYWTSQTRYTARYVFSVHDRNSESVRDLLLHFGKDVTGNNPPDIFQGESLLKLFLTRPLVQKALLEGTKTIEFLDEFVTSSELKAELPGPKKAGATGPPSAVLADYFFEQSGHASKPVFRNFSFNSNIASPLQDSALYLTYRYIVEDVVQVRRPDLKLSYLELDCSSQSPEFAINLGRRLLEEVVVFHHQIARSRARRLRDYLLQQRDSLAMLSYQEQAYHSGSKEEMLPESISVKAKYQHRLNNQMLEEVQRLLIRSQWQSVSENTIIQLIEAPLLPLPKTGRPLGQVLFFGAVAGILLNFLRLAWKGFSGR
jgi:hypothetical protein